MLENQGYFWTSIYAAWLSCIEVVIKLGLGVTVPDCLIIKSGLDVTVPDCLIIKLGLDVTVPDCLRSRVYHVVYFSYRL